MKDAPAPIGYALAGPMIAIGLGGLLVSVRDVIGNTNVALVLVVVIVTAAAFGGRTAGATTAAGACLSFNFFHSKPLYTLRVHSADDIWTIALLFVIGLVVGQVAVVARHNQSTAVLERTGAAHLEEIGAMVAQNQPPSAVWPAVKAALREELRLVDATFEPGDHSTSTMATLDRSGRFDNKVTFWSREGFELPRGGLALPVSAGEHSYGRIVLAPSQGRGTTRGQRQVAVALADLLALTIDRHPPIAGEPLSL